MKLYFAGSEIPSHRKVLREVGAKNAALSFMGLRRRIKKVHEWHLQDKFPEGMGLLLDSGAYTVNTNAMAYTQGELREISDAYQAFVGANLERVDAFIEFDALALGRDWIEERREVLYPQAPDKFVPVWHPEWGVNYLQEMAETWSNIGVPTADLQGRNLAPVLNQIASSGVRIHGVGATHMDAMREIKWHSVSSTSWVSPQQYGETHVWTGRELKRYPKKMKDQARKRYRTLFEREGFDVEKIEADDSTELLRLSIWSWETFVADIESKGNRGLHVVTSPPEEASDGFAEVDGMEVDTPESETRKSVVATRPTTPIPIMGLERHTVGDDEEAETTSITLRSESTRVCNTCFLANKCPAFEPDANCAYNIPIEIKTRDQFMAIQNALIEMQTQRVMFLRFAEEAEGGYADPNLSAEMDRLQKMLKSKNEIEQDGVFVKFEAKATGAAGQSGMIARLFGDRASEAARALPEPISADQTIIDAEVVQEWDE